MVSASAYDDKIRLYALANPALFAEQSDAIKRFIFEALQVAPSGRHRLYISPSSAWLDYTALDDSGTVARHRPCRARPRR